MFLEGLKKWTQINGVAHFYKYKRIKQTNPQASVAMNTRVDVETVLYWNISRVIFCSLVIISILATLVNNLP